MAKTRIAINFRLPPYLAARAAWRRQIHARALHAFTVARLHLAPDDPLTIHVQLQLSASDLGIHRIDDRLADVVAALQGVVSDQRAGRKATPLIPTAAQVRRVVAEKRRAPSTGKDLGLVLIRRYTERSAGARA